MSRNRKKETNAPMHTAMKYLTYSARTVREMERHLDDCQYGEVEVYETIERLKELNLLNDTQYAEDFIRTRLSSKPVSRAHLKEQLRQHELSEEILEEALLAVDDRTEAENAYLVVKKYMEQLEKLPEDERSRKVIQRAISHGFRYGDVRRAMERYQEEEPEGTDA